TTETGRLGARTRATAGTTAGRAIAPTGHSRPATFCAANGFSFQTNPTAATATAGHHGSHPTEQAHGHPGELVPNVAPVLPVRIVLERDEEDVVGRLSRHVDPRTPP